MTEDFQPDPDELLKAIQKEEVKEQSGKLKIFFGMSAGVGKTYAMLQEAQQKLKEGINVVIGTVITHGRIETQTLMEGIPIIPEKWVHYRDTVFEELDLERILKEKPSLVLVDELAHTNVPGSRHAKRWQDVIELLDAGIDVYTTLNVQHIESRKDLVESISEIQIRETVPDLVLERASSIELIDIPAQELLKRLSEGKVYLGNQSQIAARNFFKEDTLMALREIALRFTAEKVDHDLHTLLSLGKGWKTHEKLMVAISPSPTSLQLIRTARRRAFEIDAPLVVLYVDNGKSLSEEEQARLASHLNLARELGAEVVTTEDLDIAAGIQRIAKYKNITQVIVGRTPETPFFLNLFQENLIGRLEKKNKQLDILILRQDGVKSSEQVASLPFSWQSPLRDYGYAIAAVMAVTVIAFLLNHLIDHEPIGLFYIIGILFLGLRVGQGPIFFATLLSTACWYIFFISPNATLLSFSLADLVLVVVFFISAILIGLLTSRISKQDQFLKAREKKLQHLYEIEKEMASATDFQDLRSKINHELETIIAGRFELLIEEAGKGLNFRDAVQDLQDEKEQATAEWVYLNGNSAGWSTTTLPTSKGLYLPLKFLKKTNGVLVYYPEPERKKPLAMEELNFLQTVGQQLAIILEKHLQSSIK